MTRRRILRLIPWLSGLLLVAVTLTGHGLKDPNTAVAGANAAPVTIPATRSAVLEALVDLLGVSRFLWEDFLRLQHENLFPLLLDVPQLVG